MNVVSRIDIPWRGLRKHLGLTLRLNFRSRQPLIYGYLVPVFFLLAFGSVFRTGQPPLLQEMGQLLTITILGGACFGMPTAMVAEREQGVWRRYRLLPCAALGIVLSTVLARVILLAIAVGMQIVLAWAIYRTPWPAYPVELVGAFLEATFAFLGLGLLIAMLADNVPAVQALGQAIFLPVILIGGVGVPLRALPDWAQRVAEFLPGRYAVEVLQACILPEGGGLPGAKFASGALGVIGAAGFVAAGGLFRWEAGPRPVDWRARGWVIVALAAWIGAGVAADGRRRTFPLSLKRAVVQTSPANSAAKTWQSMTEADIAAIPLADLPPDDGLVTPLAVDLSGLDEDGRTRMEALRAKLAAWPPGREGDPARRTRNLLSVCAVADLVMDPGEAEIARVVFDQIKADVPDARTRRQVLAFVGSHPHEGTVMIDVTELGISAGVEEIFVRDRCAAYARKMLRETPP